MEVILNKSTKIDGKFVTAGKATVTKKQKEELEKQGLIGGEQKNQSAMTDVEAQKLMKRVEELEKQVKDGGNAELAAEIETLKADLETKAAEIETLKADLETKAAEIETLKADLENATKKK